LMSDSKEVKRPSVPNAPKSLGRARCPAKPRATSSPAGRLPARQGLIWSAGGSLPPPTNRPADLLSPPRALALHPCARQIDEQRRFGSGRGFLRTAVAESRAACGCRPIASVLGRSGRCRSCPVPLDKATPRERRTEIHARNGQSRVCLFRHRPTVRASVYRT